MLASCFTIKLVGFGASETERFAAVLALAERLLQQEWGIVTSAEADFFVLAEKDLKASVLPDISPDRCFFYDSDDSDDRGGNHIRVDVNKIPLLHSLVEVFNKAATNQPTNQPNQLGSGYKVPIPQKKNIADIRPAVLASRYEASNGCHQHFSSDQGLLKALFEATTPVLIQVNEVGIYLDPAHGFYYCPLKLEQLVPCLNLDSPLRVKPLAAPELQQLISKAQFPPQPLKQLIWCAAFKFSGGRLLQGTTPDDIVRLLRWPDLGMPGCGNYAKLAAFMHSNAMRLADIAEITRYPLAAVYDFYNACYLVGLAEKVEAIQLHEKNTDPKRQDLLGKISNRLKL